MDGPRASGGEGDPGWPAFWEHFRRHRSPPMRPRDVPVVDDGERLRRARIRKTAQDLVDALVPGEQRRDKMDYAAALLLVAELIDDLDLCSTCARNEWECACGVPEEAETPDDGFGMDRVVMTALEYAGIELPTYWEGKPTPCRRVRVVVGAPPLENWWSAALEGTVRNAVEVAGEDRTFYVDDEDGTAWALVTVRQGDPSDHRMTLPVRQVLGPREPSPERAVSPSVRRDELRVHNPSRGQPADGTLARQARMRAACADLVDIAGHRANSTGYRDLLDAAADAIRREREALDEG
ncbi:MAG TPA: hypothetical protein VFE05_24345 [Longimicrobiaceae bacterium]|jgi:hypothetical protein|nr:hypothetical protein [Longimicrobiaceae bacterium]